MALFTSAIVASFFAVEATFITATAAFALNLAVGVAISYGLSYASKALAGNPNQDAPAAPGAGVQIQLQAGADVPRSFQLGYSVTGGSLAYANTWGATFLGDTYAPNAFLVQVIAIADLPCGNMVEIWVNGEKVTFDPVALVNPASLFGSSIAEYNKDGTDHLWVKYYDGTQVAADSYLQTHVSTAERPWESTRVGSGVAYVIVTALVNETLFSGIPAFRFAVSGMALYDPSKDSTNGGSGAHRWSDPSTWGGDGDDFPAVQIYNVLRGIRYGSSWLYGLQLLTEARLPSANWIAQISKCRSAITGESGPEPTYRTGGQVPVNVQTVQTIESLLTGCQGRLSEIGGFYKIHLGAPDSAIATFSDEDILSTEEQNFAPFFGLADSVNGITAKYPSPAEGWTMKPAPPLYDADFEAEDGSRRLLADPSFDFVPYAAQAQRLQKSALQEARRARRHTLGMPPPFWIVEPGDVVEWTSLRNGYAAKQFRVDGTTDKANLDVALSITEVDPADYDWTHATDFQGISVGPATFVRPDAQGIVDWFAEPYTLYDAAGTGRRAAIRLSWDGSTSIQKGVSGAQWEVRNGPAHPVAPGVVVHRGSTEQVSAGAAIISQSLVSNTLYEARGQYIPSAPRDMLWSDWLSVTTPNVDQNIDAVIREQVNIIQDYLNDQISAGMNLIASVASNSMGGNWIDHAQIRNEIVAAAGEARASITEVKTVQVSDQTAFAQYKLEVAATFGESFSSVTSVSSAIATIEGYAAAQYSVTLDVNGYAVGFNLFNGGFGISSATFVVDKFQIASPGITGGDPVPIFTVANVNGTPKIGIRADMYVDGGITALAIAAQTITSASGVIGDLSVATLSIADNAVTVTQFVNDTGTVTGTGSLTLSTISSFTFSIDTTGISGKTVYVIVSMVGVQVTAGASPGYRQALYFNGTLIAGSTSQTLAVAGNAVLQGVASFVASGGVQTFPVRYDWTGINLDIGNRVLSANSGKR